jgi:hypothetical protein
VESRKRARHRDNVKAKLVAVEAVQKRAEAILLCCPSAGPCQRRGHGRASGASYQRPGACQRSSDELRIHCGQAHTPVRPRARGIPVVQGQVVGDRRVLDIVQSKHRPQHPDEGVVREHAKKGRETLIARHPLRPSQLARQNASVACFAL